MMKSALLGTVRDGGLSPDVSKALQSKIEKQQAASAGCTFESLKSGIVFNPWNNTKLSCGKLKVRNAFWTEATFDDASVAIYFPLSKSQ